MVLKRQKVEKQFFSITEVSDLLGVKPTVLRYWEKYFPDIVYRRAGRNIRIYNKENLKKLRIIYNLVCLRGLHVEAAAEYYRRNPVGVEQKAAAVQMLQEVRDELRLMCERLDELQ